MSSDKKKASELSDGWVLCTSKSNPGRQYYFNKRTGKSSWTQPQAEDKSGSSKQKSHHRRSKSHHREKNKKLECKKKAQKRKSDTFIIEENSKKHKSLVTPSPEKPNALKPEYFSPNKIHEDFKRILGKKKATKNIASARLTQLRAQLDAEIEKEENNIADEASPPINTNKRKSSQKITHDSPQKGTKVEVISPNLNESKCSTTTQSPGSDSFQSIPSPSQFFAATKIISSMKAQLPEEYCNKVKQNDTFADIERGICNQMPEYPFMKHPATPPQFSQADKLLNAIKSKLNNVETFTSAKERMEKLRDRLSTEVEEEGGIAEDSNANTQVKANTSCVDSMDVDTKEVVKAKPIEPPVKPVRSVVDKNENIVLVVDTNIFIHELDVIKNVLNSHIKGYTEQPTLLIPWRVISELDRLKDNNNGNGAICKRAKAAMDYLYKSLPESNRIKGQSLRDANSHIYPCEVPDDEILNCCLQQSERGKYVILLSNDKNLCNKAVINGVKCIDLNALKPLLENKPQPKSDPELYASIKHYQDTLYHLLANILENEMRAKYNNLWQHVLFKAPPWTVEDVVQCLLKHWIAVFNEVFPRIEHLLNDLKNCLASINSKAPNSISNSEAVNFKELCLDIAKKCTIIPEYMELAKATVNRLQNKKAAAEKDGEMVVIEVFEGLWTVFSSYVAKLSSGLNIPHDIEDKLTSNEPLQVLINKWPVFSNQIFTLALAIKSVLSLDNADANMDEHIYRLQCVFKESMELISMNSSIINKHDLKTFCIKCRNMLQEASNKFSQLTEILEVCKKSIGTN